MTTYITITSQKGGVGKTTNAISVAHGLALLGHEVLLVDLDPQGQTAIGLGLDPAPGVFAYMVSGRTLAECIRPASREITDDTGKARGVLDRQGLELLPGDSRTKTVTTVISSEGIDAEPMLRSMGAGHDFVVFDTPASGVLQETAIKLADILLIPGRLEAFGLDGIAATLQVAKKLLTPMRGNGEIGELLGNTLSKLSPNYKSATDAHPQDFAMLGDGGLQVVIVPVAHDRRVREHDINLALLRETYGDMVAQPIPQRIFVAECQSYGKTVWEHESYGCKEIQEAYTALLDTMGLMPKDAAE